MFFLFFLFVPFSLLFLNSKLFSFHKKYEKNNNFSALKKQLIFVIISLSFSSFFTNEFFLQTERILGKERSSTLGNFIDFLWM